MPDYTLADHELAIETARQRGKVVVAWLRVNAARLPADVAPADRRLLVAAGVLLPQPGEVWATDAAARARTVREMMDFLRRDEPPRWRLKSTSLHPLPTRTAAE